MCRPTALQHTRFIHLLCEQLNHLGLFPPATMISRRSDAPTFFEARMSVTANCRVSTFAPPFGPSVTQSVHGSPDQNAGRFDTAEDFRAGRKAARRPLRDRANRCPRHPKWSRRL